MAINKVIYSGTTLIDLTGSTVDAASLRSGKTAYDKSGTLISGGIADYSGSYTVEISDDTSGDIVLQTAGKFLTGNITIKMPEAPSTILLSDLPEGSLVAINESGTPANFVLACHNYESGNNGSGRTLMVRKAIYSKRAFRTSGNVYSGSAMDTFLTGTYFNGLDSAVRTLIGTTTIQYTSTTGSILSGSVKTMTASVFLLSVAEYGLSGGKTEGSAVPVASSLRQAAYNGTYTAHWTRTPVYNGSTHAYYLNTSGSVTNMAASESSGCRPAFTLPATAEVLSTPNADGSYTLVV